MVDLPPRFAFICRPEIALLALLRRSAVLPALFVRLPTIRPALGLALFVRLSTICPALVLEYLDKAGNVGRNRGEQRW
jgi:hypothetical protein